MTVLGPGDIVRRAAERIDRSLFPDATSAGDQWRRVVMNEAIDAHIASLRPATLSAAEISGDSHAGKPWKQYTSLNYPEFDVYAPVTVLDRFDVVICEQVLEHVIDPWGATAGLGKAKDPRRHGREPAEEHFDAGRVLSRLRAAWCCG
jgi:hypothetical protein